MVNPNVTRWAPILLEQGEKAGIPNDLLFPWVAISLGAIEKESAGDPSAQHEKSGAFGLTQQLPKFFGKETDPNKHIRKYADTFKKYLASTGGYLPTASLAWASGPGAVGHWVTNGDDNNGQFFWINKHLSYVDDLYKRAAPQYGAWLAAWAAAGQPVSRVPMTIDGKTYELDLATNGNFQAVDAPWLGGYDGAHRWQGKQRMYSPTVPTVGVKYAAMSTGLFAMLKHKLMQTKNWIMQHPYKTAGGATLGFIILRRVL